MEPYGFKKEFFPLQQSFPSPQFLGQSSCSFNPISTVHAAYHWVPCTTRSYFPATAVVGGKDSDGTCIYVGRAYHNGELIPAKVMPDKKISYVSYGGKEHPKQEFEVLCERKLVWVRTTGGYIPPGAVEGGRTSTGEILYVGRAHHANSHTVGKVHPSHKVCYISYDGKELPFKDYEILTLKDS